MSENGTLRIAMLAPPWIPVPPPGYGGIEAVVGTLTEELVARGHDVTLLAAPGSSSSAEVVTPLDEVPGGPIGISLGEADHVAAAFDLIDESAAQGRPFDVVHDHSGFVAFALADRLSTPLVHTLHGPFTESTTAFYRRHAAKGWVVAISETQLDQGPAELRVAGVVGNPLDCGSWPLQTRKDGYLLWVGRFNRDKGPHLAIPAARAAGRPLVLAGVVQPGQESFFADHIAPHVDGEAVRYVGEVGEEDKRRLFAGADALLMPIRWPEPFGMVMVEAMVCGTPVIAFAEGAATELVVEGVTGYLVHDVAGMARAVDRIGSIDLARCREVAVERCDVPAVAAGYEGAYHHAIDNTPRPRRRGQLVRQLAGLGGLR